MSNVSIRRRFKRLGFSYTRTYFTYERICIWLMAFHSWWTTLHFIWKSLRSFLRADQSLDFFSTEWCLYLGNFQQFHLFSTFICQCITPAVLISSSTSSHHLDLSLSRFLFPPGCHSITVLLAPCFPLSTHIPTTLFYFLFYYI